MRAHRFWAWVRVVMSPLHLTHCALNLSAWDLNANPKECPPTGGGTLWGCNVHFFGLDGTAH